MRFRTVLALSTTLGIGLAITLSSFALATTQRKFDGIVTAVEPTSLTLAPMRSSGGGGGSTRHTVTGKIDPKKTKVLVDGKISQIASVQLTYSAQAELGLDDVWITVRADSTP